MEIKYFVNDKKQKLSKLMEGVFSLSYSSIQKLIRNKDVKVNGRRISKDEFLELGDKIEIYLKSQSVKVEYEDDDLIVVLKPRGVETVCGNSEDLKNIIEKQIKKEVFAVHRLDRNTEGLVIFAKNLKAKDSLDLAIKNRELKKFYLAMVVGVPKIKEAKLEAYLKKDSLKSMVIVSDECQAGFEKIKTNYKLLKNNDFFSILEVELVTGKTHQIRAHLSHEGYPIVGDEKYGNTKLNKKLGKRYQCLCAYKLVFKFEKDDYLSRLNGLSVELKKQEIKFYNFD